MIRSERWSRKRSYEMSPLWSRDCGHQTRNDLRMALSGGKHWASRIMSPNADIVYEQGRIEVWNVYLIKKPPGQCKSSTEWGVACDGRARCETHHITWSSTDCVLLRNYLSGLHLHRLCATGMLLWGFLARSTCMRPDQLSPKNKPQRNLGSPELMPSATC